MTSSQILINAIKSFEGCRLTAYKPVPTEKYWTIGYGHYGADVKQGMKITALKAEELLRQDLKRFENTVTAINVCKTQGQFDALVDFAYNCGIANLMNSTLLKKIKAGVNSPTLVTDCMATYPAGKMPTMTKQQMLDRVVQCQFLRWNRSNGKVLGGLTKRRTWEGNRWAQ